MAGRRTLHHTCVCVTGAAFTGVYGRTRTAPVPRATPDRTSSGWGDLGRRPSVKALAAAHERATGHERAVSQPATVMWSGANADNTDAFNTSYQSDLSSDDEAGPVRAACLAARSTRRGTVRPPSLPICDISSNLFGSSLTLKTRCNNPIFVLSLVPYRSKFVYFTVRTVYIQAFYVVHISNSSALDQACFLVTRRGGCTLPALSLLCCAAS